MRVFGLSLIILALTALRASAAVGDQWILGIDHFNNPSHGSFSTIAGGYPAGSPRSSGDASYSTGSAYRYATTTAGGPNPAPDGVARVIWNFTGNSTNGNNTPVPSSTQLYSIEFFGTPVGTNNFQPIESQFHGIVGEGNDGYPSGYPFPNPPPPGPSTSIDAHIPWYGASGVNHQFMKSDLHTLGDWNAAGPGPHAPNGPAANAGANGNYMWLTAGSWLYAKWDFTFAVDRSWSAIRLTQVTPIVGPPIEGDYNANGVVDAADYVIWRNTLGQTGENLAADGYPDEMIDDFDYFIWQGAFGDPFGSGSSAGNLSSLASVPEPVTIAMFALAGLVCCTGPLRRRGSTICS